MKGYENVDEKKLFKLFCSDKYIIDKPRLKDDKVFATNGKITIYVNAEICQGKYEKTEKFNVTLPSIKQELQIPLLNILKAYDSLPKGEHEEYDVGDCNECHSTGFVKWQYTDKKGITYHEDFDCPVCDGLGFQKRNSRKVYGPEKSAVIKLDGFLLLHWQIKTIIDTLFVLGKDHITLLSKNKTHTLVWVYLRVDENITILVSPCCYINEDAADAIVEL